MSDRETISKRALARLEQSLDLLSSGSETWILEQTKSDADLRARALHYYQNADNVVNAIGRWRSTLLSIAASHDIVLSEVLAAQFTAAGSFP